MRTEPCVERGRGRELRPHFAPDWGNPTWGAATGADNELLSEFDTFIIAARGGPLSETNQPETDREAGRKASRKAGGKTGREFEHSLATIYAAYKDLKAVWKRGSGWAVKDRLQEQFDILDWQWTRVKVVYETYLIENDVLAGELIKKVDDGEITISAAYRLLRERTKQEAAVGRMKSLKLYDLHQRHLGDLTYAKLVFAALAVKVPLNLAGLSADEVKELPALLRATGLLWQRAADKLSDQLTPPKTGGATPNGSRSKR